MRSSEHRRRLIFLSQTLPFPLDGGVFIRTYNVLRLLAKTYDVRLLAFDRRNSGPEPRRLEEARLALGELATVSVVPVPQDGSRARFVADHLRSLLTDRFFTHYRYAEPHFERLLEAELADGYDIIHVDSLDLARFLPRLPNRRVVLTHQNVESQLLRDRALTERSAPLRAYVRRQAKLMEDLEKHWCPRVALNIAVSDRDASELQRIAPGSETVTVRNGVDVAAIRPSEEPSDGSIVCVGGLAWFPNQDALDFLCSEVLPLLREKGVADPRLVWVGRATTSAMESYARRYGVQLTGYVDDVMPYVRRAACYIMPFRLGGGTRLKLLEAMAAGKPIVSTKVGAMGVDAEDGRHLLLAESADEIAAAVTHILSQPALSASLGRAARALAVEKFSWKAIGESMLRAYGRVA